jgi:drug/metabolite transporter (DMT)-like permease
VDQTVERRPWVAAFAALALIWGSSFVFIKVGVGQVAPAYVALARVALGALTLFVILLVTRDRLPRDRRLWGHLIVVATLANLIPFTLFGYAEDGRVSSVLAGIWNATTPLVTLVVTIAVFPTERATRERVLGLLLGFAGVLTVLGVWRGVGGASLAGQLMCLGAAVCYGLMFPYVRRFVAGRPESGTSIACAQTLIATVQLGVIAPLLAGAPANPLHLRSTVLGSVLVLGVLGTGLAYVLNYRVIRVAGASTASTVTYLMPIVSTFAGVVVLGEQIRWNAPVGALVILLGVAVSQGRLRPSRLRPRRDPVQPELGDVGPELDDRAAGPVRA